MKLLVFSDSHNRPKNMLEAIRHETGVDALVFLGDGQSDPAAITAAFPALPLYAVQGNCDPGSYDPYEALAPFGGVLFFYTHGHAYGVKESPDMLAWTAKRRGADVALFGHTHMPLIEERGDITLFNPGSITMPRAGRPTYGRVTITDAKPAFEIVKFQAQHLLR